MRRLSVLVATITLLSAGLQVGSQARADTMGCGQQPDFNGDGFADLAVGVPVEDITGANTDDGAVNVLYGGSSGLSGVGDQVWHQNSDGVLETAETNDIFGTLA